MRTSWTKPAHPHVASRPWRVIAAAAANPRPTSLKPPPPGTGVGSRSCWPMSSGTTPWNPVSVPQRCSDPVASMAADTVAPHAGARKEPDPGTCTTKAHLYAWTWPRFYTNNRIDACESQHRKAGSLWHLTKRCWVERYMFSLKLGNTD